MAESRSPHHGLPDSPPNIIVITGPTGSGKTALSLQLATTLGGEIVNADSVQIYRDFDIGSAKPTPSEMAKVPHHLVSVLDPSEQINAGLFVELADRAIADIISRGKVPILTGGTGLYVRALLCGLVESEDRGGIAAVAQRIAEWKDDEIREKLHAWLATVDPRSAALLPVKDIARVRRALEFFLSHGRSISDAKAEHGNRECRYRALVFVQDVFERSELYRRIDARVEEMFDLGLEEEVAGLRRRYQLQSPPFGAIGYRELIEGEGRPREEVIALVKQNTRRFAKRQLTWWRHQPQKLGWQEGGGIPGFGIEELAVRFLKRAQPIEEDGIFVVPLSGIRPHSGL